VKYQIGDTVLILHSNEEGIITDIINDKMLLVDVQGTQFPVYMDQVDFPYFKRFTEKKTQPVKKEKQYVDDLRKEKKPETPRTEDGMWLSFLPVMDTDEFGDLVVEKLKLYLLNHTASAYQFEYRLSYSGRPDLHLKQSILPFADFYLQDIPFEYLNDNPVFGFEFMLTPPDKKKQDYTEATVKLKPKQLFEKIEGLIKNNQPTFTQRLFERYPDKLYDDLREDDSWSLQRLAAKGFKVYESGKGKHIAEPARSVVDLHIEKITDQWRGMPNFEILSLQLKTFEKYYDLAIHHHLPSFIVIHGVGEGVLREEIHSLLRLKKEVKSFVNQYHPLFGFGATEIFFK